MQPDYETIDSGEFYASQIAIKRLTKVWFKFKHLGITKENTIIIDDTPLTYCQNYGNAIPVLKSGRANARHTILKNNILISLANFVAMALFLLACQ